MSLFVSHRMLDDDRPYVKKPPNAFMLFIREQRDNVDPELKKQGSAAVNVFLGQVVSQGHHLSLGKVLTCFMYPNLGGCSSILTKCCLFAVVIPQ